MQFFIEPYKSVGDIKLGMNIHEIPKNIDIPLEREGSDSSEFITDENLKEGIRIEYQNDICVVIELFKPAEIIYNNINLLSLSYENILGQFTTIEKNFYSDGAALILLDTGIGFYFTDMDNKSYPQVISVFNKGQYDKFLIMFKKINPLLS